MVAAWPMGGCSMASIWAAVNIYFLAFAWRFGGAVYFSALPRLIRVSASARLAATMVPASTGCLPQIVGRKILIFMIETPGRLPAPVPFTYYAVRASSMAANDSACRTAMSTSCRATTRRVPLSLWV